MNISRVIELWDGLLFSTYNAFISFYSFFALPSIVKKSKVLKNKYAGERCFIIMNGPSINKCDLSHLKDEIVFASNYFFRSDLPSVVNPNYYCWADSKIFKDNNSTIVLQGIKDKCPGAIMLLNHKAYPYWGKDDGTCYVYCKHMPNAFSINNNLAKCASNFGTVALFAINAALYMGFKYIYVLGLDFEPGAFTHFTNLGDDSECTDPNAEVSKEEVCGHYWGYTKSQYESFYLRRFAEKRGQHIINLNPHSYIRAFEFGNYSELFK